MKVTPDLPWSRLKVAAGEAMSAEAGSRWAGENSRPYRELSGHQKHRLASKECRPYPVGSAD